MSRKLVTIRPVKDVQPIKNADLIEKLTVDGWNVVSGKGNFKVGDYGLFFEVDSGLPVEDDRFEFLIKGGTKDFYGKKVIRIRTMKLRGTISQGLMLPIEQFPEIEQYLEDNELSFEDVYKDRVDFAQMLDVVKYEPPLKIRGAEAAGDFPFWIKKTDQERINNVFDDVKEDYGNQEFILTLKMDGSSGTFSYVTDEEKFNNNLEVDDDGGQFFVCSRTMTLKDGSSIWNEAAKSLNLYEKLKQFHLDSGRTLAFQGEVLGRGVQGTREKIYDYTVHFFSIWDVDHQHYLTFPETKEIVESLGLKAVDVIDTFKPFESFDCVEDFIEYSDKIEPRYADIPEGIVYHSLHDGNVSFKAISTKYLLKNE